MGGGGRRDPSGTGFGGRALRLKILGLKLLLWERSCNFQLTLMIDVFDHGTGF